MNFNIKSKLTILTILGVSILITACGGGSTSTVSESNNLSLVTIDNSNQKQATAVLFDSIDITTPQLPAISTDAGGLAKVSAPLFKAAVSGQEPLKSISAGESYNCSEGGSISSSYADGVSTIIYDNCQEVGTTINGQVKMSYNELTGVITYTISEYSIISQGINYTTPTTTYTISSDMISYTATGEATIDGQNVAFDKYHYTLSRVDNNVNISIDGSLKTACLGNWITVKTNEVMQLSDTNCPTAGNFEVQGDNSKLRVKFSADKSVDVYLNDALVEEYSNCNELPDSSSVCGV